MSSSLPARHLVAVALSLSLLIAAACDQRGLASVSGPNIPRPRFSMDCQMPSDSTLNAWKCGEIYSGIQDLMGSNNPYCQSLGLSAYIRYNATGYGYRAGVLPNQGYLAYTVMDPNGPGQYTSSGDHPVDDSVYFQDFWTMFHPFTIAGVIAHEEVHQAGDENRAESMGSAWGATATCGSVY